MCDMDLRVKKLEENMKSVGGLPTVENYETTIIAINLPHNDQISDMDCANDLINVLDLISVVIVTDARRIFRNGKPGILRFSVSSVVLKEKIKLRNSRFLRVFLWFSKPYAERLLESKMKTIIQEMEWDSEFKIYNGKIIPWDYNYK